MKVFDSSIVERLPCTDIVSSWNSNAPPLSRSVSACSTDEFLPVFRSDVTERHWRNFGWLLDMQDLDIPCLTENLRDKTNSDVKMETSESCSDEDKPVSFAVGPVESPSEEESDERFQKIENAKPSSSVPSSSDVVEASDDEPVAKRTRHLTYALVYNVGRSLRRKRSMASSSKASPANSRRNSDDTLSKLIIPITSKKDSRITEPEQKKSFVDAKEFSDEITENTAPCGTEVEMNYAGRSKRKRSKGSKLRMPLRSTTSNARYCICRQLYDPRKLYVQCSECLQWFHGKCVGISTRKLKRESKWTCKNCFSRKQFDDSTLYCICRAIHDDSRFYVACDSCDKWFHPECVGISRSDAEHAKHFFCPYCANK